MIKTLRIFLMALVFFGNLVPQMSRIRLKLYWLKVINLQPSKVILLLFLCNPTDYIVLLLLLVIPIRLHQVLVHVFPNFTPYKLALVHMIEICYILRL
jgi:hypothetical protein